MTAARGLAAILPISTRRLCEQPELLPSSSEMGRWPDDHAHMLKLLREAGWR
jgi:hypothetical protein